MWLPVAVPAVAADLWDVILILPQILIAIGEAVHTIAMPLAPLVVPHIVTVVGALHSTHQAIRLLCRYRGEAINQCYSCLLMSLKANYYMHNIRNDAALCSSGQA